MKYNVLVTAIGSFSATTVINSLNEDSRINKVYGCDIYPKEWHYISKECVEVFKAPLVSQEKEYLQFIKKIVSIYNIDIIIPLTDIEVDFFNQYRDHFNDILVTIGSSEFLSLARDKYKLNNYLSSKDIKIPKTYGFNELNKELFPLIGKPKNGRSSEGIVYLQNYSDLSPYFNYGDYIFQEIINGEIITIDMVRDDRNNSIAIIPRKELIRTKNGAGTTVELLCDEHLVQLSSDISQNLNATGAYNIEFIATSHDFYLIDVNPRFSAGIGFTHTMGYNMVSNMINYYTNSPIEEVIEYKHMIVQKQMQEVINKIF
ncbi:ATP-grasp domain-containing protein [Empedobacter falsenii]